MGIESGPSQDDQRIEDSNMVEEMANAEKPIQEKILIAKKLGLKPDKLHEMGVEADEEAQRAREEYEEVMSLAEDTIADALSEGGTYIQGSGESKDFFKKVQEAVKYRLSENDSNTGELKMRDDFKIIMKDSFTHGTTPEPSPYLEYLGK